LREWPTSCNTKERSASRKGEWYYGCQELGKQRYGEDCDVVLIFVKQTTGTMLLAGKLYSNAKIYLLETPQLNKYIVVFRM
jgi:hypothetical protein